MPPEPGPKKTTSTKPAGHKQKQAPPAPERKSRAREHPRGSTRSAGSNASPSDGYRIGDPAEFGRNFARVVAKSQKLVSSFVARQAERAGKEPIDPLNIGGAFLALFRQMAKDPGKILEAQTDLWREHLALVQRTAQRLSGHAVDPVVTADADDRRFRHPDWEENQIFDYIKQSYLLSANWLQRTVGGVEGMDSKAQARAAFYAKQFSDAIAPTNFVLTNPEVLRETLASNGENLVRGLDNLLHDLDRGEGRISIRHTTENFVVGRDVALTPGKVVYRNPLFELLQYEPTTDTAYATPLLIFPPWINKFYILDLQPKNSFVKWAVDAGYTVFVVSWVNPDARFADKGLEDYMRDGIFAALDAVEQATGQRQVNAIGYCIAGTLLAATLAYVAASGDYKDRIKSATFLAAQVDFSEAGELQVFVDDQQLAAMEEQMKMAGGVLEGAKMAMTFNMLRANDLIWSFVVNNYLMGKDPAPFDLLYWNSDTTRMPLKLHLSYLRQCYRDNALAEAKMEFAGHRLDVRKVKTPVYIQAAKEDHIAPARSVYKGAKLFRGQVSFMLAGSGHIAGVVNPPAAGKYQHWTNAALPETFDEWLETAVKQSGSWWPTWERWLAKKSGEKIPAPHPGDGELKVLGDAPGKYVMVKARSS